jgi:hypothetical protein
MLALWAFQLDAQEALRQSGQGGYENSPRVYKPHLTRIVEQSLVLVCMSKQSIFE